MKIFSAVYGSAFVVEITKGTEEDERGGVDQEELIGNSLMKITK